MRRVAALTLVLSATALAPAQSDLGDAARLFKSLPARPTIGQFERAVAGLGGVAKLLFSVDAYRGWGQVERHYKTEKAVGVFRQPGDPWPPSDGYILSFRKGRRLSGQIFVAGPRPRDLTQLNAKRFGPDQRIDVLMVDTIPEGKGSNDGPLALAQIRGLTRRLGKPRKKGYDDTENVTWSAEWCLPNGVRLEYDNFLSLRADYREAKR